MTLSFSPKTLLNLLTGLLLKVSYYFYQFKMLYINFLQYIYALWTYSSFSCCTLFIFLGGAGPSEPLENILTSGDDTIIFKNSSVAWDGSATSHTKLTGSVGVCGAVGRRVVYMDQKSNSLWEVQPHSNPVGGNLFVSLSLKF